MNPCLLKFSLVLFSLFLFSKTHSQSNSSDPLKPNIVYGTYGLVTINGAYERLIATPKEKRFFTSYWTKIGYGYWSEPFGGRGNNFSLSATALTGSKNNHFEMNLGASSFFDRLNYDIGVSNSMIIVGGSGITPPKSDYRFIRPTGAIGYRFQKPGGHFVFRTGIGFPDVVYLSLGFCF